MKVDRIQIQQVLVNGVRNAVEAMTRSGSRPRRIEIETAVRDGDACICVTDHGPGLATELEDKLFEQFYTTKENGMGLGLSLWKTIAEAHGGRITLENNPGGGAAFCLFLPPSSG